MKHGKGTLYYQNGDKFEGMFIDNLRNGYGIMYYSNGDKYEGDWKFNKKNGFGIYINKKEQNVYIGYWMNNQKEGPGYCKYNHDKNKLYIAEWINDKPNCGYFVNINDNNNNIDFENVDKYENAKNVFPELGLIDSEYILTREIKDIRAQRKLIRHLTIIDDIDELFEHENELKDKIIDIFDQIAVPKYNHNINDDNLRFQCTEQCYVNKENLYDAIQDFNLPSPFDSNQETEIKKLHLFIGKYCNDLGIEKSKEKSNENNMIFVMTLLDFSKIVYLLLNHRTYSNY